MAVAISPPDQASLLAPLLPALPVAAAATQPAVKLLPLLSPILRQRVQLLSESSSEPWLRLLCYDADKTGRLAEIARGESLEPHPVSGEVEIDWGYDAETRYRRLDQETLQALVVLSEIGIAFLLVYCVGDQVGGGDGWRIGEVTVAEKPSPFVRFGGAPSIVEAERQYAASGMDAARSKDNADDDNGDGDGDDDDDDDDAYWGRYDLTPGRLTPRRTPANKRSPAPRSMLGQQEASGEDAYFSQYDHVQPAADGHDPDEEMAQTHLVPPLGLQTVTNETTTEKANPPSATETDIVSPRPASSASSSGCDAIARLEESAGRQEQTEFGVRQHVARSIRSLYMVSRATGMSRDDFQRLVERELAVLGMVEGDE
ncbi:hypothetical protein CDD80_6396 [Ophiocordyceps camponoti-rufipedis]|uniref:Uncharacterized protein n=1 Tax=Ophiocordyceps camponoti-rufipedis TaxID=2004952 RepID=A0A2C5YK45_9HYPO|nr:hypothetical protein CDD80_6396 [Ophiocordyceps camponoti-rufipedis]